MHLDAGYDYRPCREALEDRGLLGEIASRGTPAPIQVGRRWVVERTNSWLNDFGRLRRCTERRRACVDAYLALAAAIVTVRASTAGRLVPLPLGHPTKITADPLTYWRGL